MSRRTSRSEAAAECGLKAGRGARQKSTTTGATWSLPVVTVAKCVAVLVMALVAMDLLGWA